MASRALAPLRTGLAGREARVLLVGGGWISDTSPAAPGEAGGTAVQVVGAIADERPSGSAALPHLGRLDALPKVLRTHQISDVTVCLQAAEWPQLATIVRTCEEHQVRISTLSFGLPLARRTLLEAFAKRAIDIGGAIAALVVAAPLLAAAALAILIFDGRPVFFRQQRAGLGGRPFSILKFRSMEPGADRLRDRLREASAIDGAAFKMADDPRVTRLGRWLRRTSIDELPQLWNVLKGEMSLVGPRPHPYDDVGRYEPWHLRRLSVKPGITGMWQVELRGDTDFNRWVAKDLEYIDRWSIWLDAALVARTIPAVLRGTGR